jgi:hypothetical protein
VKKITTLTHEQKALFPEYVERWTKIGLSCEPIDRTRAKAAVDLAYRCAGLKEPSTVIWADGPMSGGIIYTMLKETSVWASVRASVRDSVRASVWDSVRASVWDSVWASVRASVVDSVRASVWDSV